MLINMISRALLSVPVNILIGFAQSSSANIFFFPLVLSPCYRPSTQSFPSWWKNTLSREEQSRPCTKRCWETPQAAVSTWNIGPRHHGWVSLSVHVCPGLSAGNTARVKEQEPALSIVTCLALVCNCFMIKKKTNLLCSALVFLRLSAGSQLEVAVRCHSSGHRQRGLICGDCCQKLN